MRKTSNVPHGVFVGQNFMTPNWLGYYKLRRGYAELSKGRGIYNEPLYGVTVRDANGERFSPDPSNCFRTRREAEALIEELS